MMLLVTTPILQFNIKNTSDIKKYPSSTFGEI